MSARVPDQSAASSRPPEWDDPDLMLGVDEGRERILSAIQPVGVVEIPLLEALDRVLAADIQAADNVPPFRNSAMDGYAVRAEDLTGCSLERPVELTVVAEIPAGSAPEVVVGPGQAARIMTGAVMPEGADTVVRFEETSEGPEGSTPASVVVRAAPRQGSNVRLPGEDIRAGTLVLPKGTLLRPSAVGVLASANVSVVPVFRKPRVAILSTGDEVIDPGDELKPGQIRNSNSFTLAAMTRQFGGEPFVLGVARDRFEDLRERLRRAGAADLIVTSGGVSIGDYDVVKDVLRAEGQIDLWQVRIKPGKPMAFGRVGGVPLIGLPGNPVAAAVAFLQFGLPALCAMQGRSDWRLPRLRARLLADHENRGRRRHFVRGFMEQRGEELVVRPVGSQGSGVLTSLVQANCLIVLPESCDHAAAGMIVDVDILQAGWVV
jgi:molybdopterin molybdotransferase